MGRKILNNVTEKSANTSQVEQVVLGTFDQKTNNCEIAIESFLASAKDNVSALLNEIRNQKQL